LPPKPLSELHAVILMFVFQGKKKSKQVKLLRNILTHVFYSL